MRTADGRQPATGVTRRQALRWGAAASVSAGLWLAGCAGQEKTAAPTANEPHIHLFVTPWASAPGGSSPAGQKLLQEGLQHWSSQFRNVDVHIGPNNGGNPSALINSILTGTGPDIFEAWTLAPFFSGDIVLPLNDYMKQDGVKPDLWTSSVMRVLSPNGQVLALPSYTNVYCMTVNLSFFDSKGLERPNQDWTYKDLESLAPQIMNTVNGTRQPGLIMGTWDNSIGNRTWLYQAFGGGIVDSTGTKSTMSTPNSLAAGKWLYDGLILPGYAKEQNDAYDLPQSVLLTNGTAEILYQVEHYSGFVWDYYPMPYYPVAGATSPQSTWRRATYQTDDSYLISAATRHPKHAWSLLRWLCAEAYWQTYMFSVFLLPPSLNSLWSTWLSTVQSRVPPLADKNLQAFSDSAINGWGFPQQYYAYNDADCELKVNPFIVDIHDGTMGVTEAFQNIDHVVDAFEASAAQVASAAGQANQALASVQPGPTTHYPLPASTGAGAPSTPSPYVQAQTGAYTLLGDGGSMGGQADTCVFAAAATTATEDTWTCRVTALANISEQANGQPQLANWTRAGLMARGDLSDDAAMVLLSITGYYGFDFLVRPAPGATVREQKFIFMKGSGGAPQTLVSPVSQPAANYLVRPIWLRLTRKGTVWTPYASLDGTSFSQLGPSLVANALAGAWVGVTVNAYNTEFNHHGYVRATFDHIAAGTAALTPTQMVQIGSSGAPPSAGPVPNNWATGSFQ